jgi:hypothetical protein
MILHLSFEELCALSAEAERVLAGSRAAGYGVAAPPQFRAEVEQFAELLVGDVEVENLVQQRSMQRVIDHLLNGCRLRLDATIVDLHPAAEQAVAAYFDYAHMLVTRHRLAAIGSELEALVHSAAGGEPDPEAGSRFAL